MPMSAFVSQTHRRALSSPPKLVTVDKLKTIPDTASDSLEVIHDCGRGENRLGFAPEDREKKKKKKNRGTYESRQDDVTQRAA